MWAEPSPFRPPPLVNPSDPRERSCRHWRLCQISQTGAISGRSSVRFPEMRGSSDGFFDASCPQPESFPVHHRHFSYADLPYSNVIGILGASSNRCNRGLVFGIFPVSEPFSRSSSQSHRVSGQVTIDEANLTNSWFATGHLSLLSSRGRITLHS